MFLFQAIIKQMGHDICHRLRDYWTSAAQFFTPLYPNTMTQDHFLHILRYTHFTDNDKEVKKNNDNYDRPWKIKEVFDTLDVAHSNFYNPSEYLATDEVIVLFRGRQHSSSISQTNTNISELKFTNSVTFMATHMTRKCNEEKTENRLQPS